MKLRTLALTGALLIVFGLASQAIARDVASYAGVNLKVRSAPSVRFPVAGVVGAGSDLTIRGCLARYCWCDVSAGGVRGWAPGALVEFVHEAQQIYVPARPALVEIPIVTFNLTSY